MKKRQFLAALLAVCCAASLAVPASAAVSAETMATTAAAETDLDFNAVQSYELDVDTGIQKPSLKVTLPGSTAVLVNPYRIEIDVDGAGNTSFDTVLSPEMEIINNSACAIKVSTKGLLQTYTVKKDFDKTDAAVTEFDMTAPITNVDVINPTDITKIYAADSTFKTFYTEDGKQVTATYTAPNTTVTPVKKGSLKVTGYTVSKDIKVATAALKDVDAEKSNSLFLYVEGSKTSGTWASAFDAKKVATGASAPTGMMALSAKDTTASILYLGSGETGYARVTGQAATAPTKAWSTVTDTFDAKFTFVIDAVANAAPKAPLATDIKVGGVSLTGFAPEKLEYTANATATDGILAVTVVADAGATQSITVDGVLSKAGANITMTGAGTGTVTIALTQFGMTTTYTINVTVA